MFLMKLAVVSNNYQSNEHVIYQWNHVNPMNLMFHVGTLNLGVGDRTVALDC